MNSFKDLETGKMSLPFLEEGKLWSWAELSSFAELRRQKSEFREAEMMNPSVKGRREREDMQSWGVGFPKICVELLPWCRLG